MQGLLADTDEVTAHPAVNDPLLGDYVEFPFNLEYPDPRCDDNGLLTCPVKVPVDEMFLEGVEGNVENLQEVSLGGSRESGSGCRDTWPGVVVDHKLTNNNIKQLLLHLW